jgi:CubicO group peptidase (beta-lactamase class C family)
MKRTLHYIVGFRDFWASVFVATISLSLAACGTRNGSDLPAPLAVTAPLEQRSENANPIGVIGSGKNPQLDKLVFTFMTQNRVPNAELAVSYEGRIFFSHAYTYKGLAPSTTTRNTIIRLASLTKAWTSAALYDLIRAHKINTNWKACQYLGLTRPLPVGAKVDPRVYDITIEDMIQHESGWDDQISHFDPTFSMRSIALDLKLKRPINQIEELRFQLKQPLQQAPGTTYAYCNFCYTVLGMVVAKASGMSYPDFVTRVARHIGVDNVLISPTVGARLPNEVSGYYNPYNGRSAYYIQSNKPYPWPYSGDGLLNEVAAGAGGLATSADSMLALMDHYIIWGVGPPPRRGSQAAREGEMPGANSNAEQLPNGVHYAFLVNTNAYAYGSSPYAFINLQNSIVQILEDGKHV